MAQLVSKLKARGVTLAVETQGSRWQEWLKDIDQVTLSPKPPSSKMEVNMETLDFIVSQLDLIKLTFKVPVFDDADLAFAKMIQERYQPDVMFLSAVILNRKQKVILSTSIRSPQRALGRQ